MSDPETNPLICSLTSTSSVAGILSLAINLTGGVPKQVSTSSTLTDAPQTLKILRAVLFWEQGVNTDF